LESFKTGIEAIKVSQAVTAATALLLCYESVIETQGLGHVSRAAPALGIFRFINQHGFC
jgi:hypothetical protein